MGGLTLDKGTMASAHLQAVHVAFGQVEQVVQRAVIDVCTVRVGPRPLLS